MEDLKFLEAVSQRIKDLAEKSGVGMTTIYYIIGAKKRIKADIIYLIARAFGMNLSEFFNDPMFDDRRLKQE